MAKKLLMTATDDETGELMAVYQEGDGVRVCPLARWEECANAAPDAEHTDDPLHETLRRVYGYSAFRDGQEDLIRAILAGRDALGVMPTGSGKSVCYQLPALLMPGTTLVVSPLISLMADQVRALTQMGVQAAYLNSALTERQFELALSRLEAGAYKIVYVAPERLLTPRFLGVAKRLTLSLIAVDEAHCISQWGQDFRPSYLSIPDFIETLPIRPPVCAFTATATKRVCEDIVRALILRDPYERMTGFDRPNLMFRVIRGGGKADTLLSLLRGWPEASGIVYCATRKSVEDICEKLLREGISTTRYHAGLSDAERRANQDDFSYDRRRVMVATNAFGMGIDKSDVRFVVHYNMPKDLEAYYQEAGRAGRDGEYADCVLLFSAPDIYTQKFLIEKSGEEADLDAGERARLREAALARLDVMIAYCRTPKCLRQYILRYFGEDAPDHCERCGNCRNPAPLVDQSALARPILACVAETGQRFGRVIVARVLLGSGDQRIKSYRLDQIASFGALRDMPRATVNTVIDQLTDFEYLTIDEPPYAIMRLTPRAREALAGAPIILPELTQLGRKRKKQAAATDAAVNPIRFAELRALRTRIAEASNIPAYMVFGDASLRAMCELAPKSEEEMLRLTGVGAARCQKYGRAFLDVINNWPRD